MKEKNIKDIARIISRTNAPSGTIKALSLYFEDEFKFNSTIFEELSNGMSNDIDLEVSAEHQMLKWAYTKTEDKDRNDAITKSNIRMAHESGFGVPNDEWERKRCMLNNGED